MEISPRKPSKRAQEPIDEWLQNEGYFRKHAPRDPTCLFRAVSEQVYLTQHYHIKVRKECVEYMRRMKHLFKETTTVPFNDYLEQMACFTEWGGMNEIQAMSLLYEREFVIFYGQKQISRTVTNNGFKDMIYLCHTPQKQYESIYTRQFVANAAFCQSIVYQVLYKNVFHMPNIEATVHKMLHDRSTTLRHDKFFLKVNIEMRDQLAAEIYNKIESGNKEGEDSQTGTRNIPPFPYRIAKALDPNIYRNTDFDIWHEIKREVKNAGWTRHNSHELQIGGKCLVQMDFNEEDFDKANNNNVYVSSLEKDSNANDTKVRMKKGKDSVFYYGHIQEMSKNFGPVLVFIEELGEKKVVPYSCLTPLPLKKNKQSNWLPVCKKNMCLESMNQKWKKTCFAPTRKIKVVTNENILSNNTDEKETASKIVNDINKNEFQWKDAALKVEHKVHENYTVEKRAGYSANDSMELFSARMILDNDQSPVGNNNNYMLENNKENEKKDTFAIINSDNNLLSMTKSDNVINNDKDMGFNSCSSMQRMQKETYYMPYSGDSSTQMDHMLRSINCSVQKSIDVNGSDLPLSDPFTLRFFYNLGLEYFRGGSNWNYLTNEQLPGFGQWYQGITPNLSRTINGTLGDNMLMQQRKDGNINTKENEVQSLPHKNLEKPLTDTERPIYTQKNEIPNKDDTKHPLHMGHERPKGEECINKEASRFNRSGLGPRFKKTFNGGRFKSTSHFTNQYPVNSLNAKTSKLEKDTKGNSVNIPHMLSSPQQLQNATNSGMNTYQTPYMQQGIYSGLPYYTNDLDTFANTYYQPNPGYIPVPCLPHSDIQDGNNVQALSSRMYPGIDYAQAYSGLCPPYLCPPPPPFNIPPQNVPEHWFAVAGQPHYMSYAPMLPVAAPETSCNGITQNMNQNAST